ncbi:MAG TPA: hypothetical protein VMB21_06485, partial [Candidatus Limnocylindria bacterium]|nr:hypothetical protein [Candidatus Limnocylindria bacterium]
PTRKKCEHCQSVVPRRLPVCPACERWLDRQTGWVSLTLELYRLRGPLIFLGLLTAFLVWAFRRLS